MMKNSEIIRIIKDSVLSVAKVYDAKELGSSFCSDIIAAAIYLYETKKTTDMAIKDYNNPLGIVDPSTGEFVKFNSLDECILTYKNNNDMIEDSKLDQIKRSCNLSRFDKEYFDSVDKTIVDLSEEKTKPQVDMYTVTKGDTILTSTMDLQQAKEVRENNAGSEIRNSRNEIVGEKVTIGKVKSITYMAGSKVILNNANLFYKFRDSRPGRSISGEYYMYDGKIINGRIAICNKLGDLLGFVKESELK